MIVDVKLHPKQMRRERDRLRGRLGKGRFDALVKELAGTVRLAFEAGITASIWGLEGPLRAEIRADLCRQSWAWETADLMAREMLASAFLAVNAKRPAWEEGQPEWTIHAGTLIERTRCIRCHGPLPEGHHKFCDGLCAASHQQRLRRLKEASEDLTVSLATRSI